MNSNSSKKSSPALIFEGQWLHALALLVLLTGCYLAVDSSGVDQGELWGISSNSWYWIAIDVAILHQIYVWFCWRLELHGKYLSRTLGNGAFGVYSAGFAVFGITRIFTVFALSFANQASLDFEPTLLKIISVIILLPALYLFYSVKRYFTFTRALGADHFKPSYRDKPFVREGIFKYTSNGMYVFGFLLLWVPALWWSSSAGIIVALFNHLYIWVHYYATERPDIDYIYSDSKPV